MIGTIAVALGYVATGFGVVGTDLNEQHFNRPVYTNRLGLTLLFTALWPIRIWRGYAANRRFKARAQVGLFASFAPALMTWLMFGCGIDGLLYLIVWATRLIR